MKHSGYKRKRNIMGDITFIALTMKGNDKFKEMLYGKNFYYIEINDENEEDIMNSYTIPTLPCILAVQDGFQLSTYIPKDYDLQNFYNFVDQELIIPDICSKTHFNHIIKNKDDYVIFNFYSTDCKPCNRIKEHLPDIIKQYDDCKFFKISFNKYPSLVKQCGVEKIPTFVVFKDGEQKGLLQHSDPKLVSNFLKEIINPNSLITFEEDF